MFYKQEVFAVDQPDITIPLENVQGFCAVMPVKEYTKGCNALKCVISEYVVLISKTERMETLNLAEFRTFSTFAIIA